MTYGQTRDALSAALSASLSDDEDEYIWVADFSDTYVIYEVGFGEYLQDDYSIDQSGNVVLAGKPAPVKPMTTYVPMEQEDAIRTSLEHRGFRFAAPEHRTARAPALNPVTSEPLTYHQHGRNSFFRDRVFSETPGAQERLEHHRSEMDVISAERERRAWGRLHSAEVGYERRVEPNTTAGTGGNFTPPLWLTDMFATARRPGRVLAGLIPGRFTLPMGVSSVNIPIINAGTLNQQDEVNSAVPDGDITDQAGSSLAVTFAGMADIALQDLELSPVGASIDMAIWADLTESYDADLEAALLYGTGTTNQQLPGIVPAAQSASQTVTFTSGSPTGALLWPNMAQAAAQLGDSRELPPECLLMRTARWFWLQGQTSTNGYPFGISPVFLGIHDDTTPNPIGGVMGLPTFLNDSVTATSGAGGNQDQVIAVRPSDLLLFETAPLTAVMQEPGSGVNSVRLQMHGYAAAITRYTSAVYVVSGTGLVVQSGY